VHRDASSRPGTMISGMPPASSSRCTPQPAADGFQQRVRHAVPQRRLQIDVAELQVGVHLGRFLELPGDQDALLLQVPQGRFRGTQPLP